jgi:hypothetical protein
MFKGKNSKKSRKYFRYRKYIINKKLNIKFNKLIKKITYIINLRKWNNRWNSKVMKILVWLGFFGWVKITKSGKLFERIDWSK